MVVGILHVPKSNNGKTLHALSILEKTMHAGIYKNYIMILQGETYLSASGKFVQPEGQPNDQL